MPMTKDEAVAFLKELRADAITLSDETSSERVRRVFIGRAAMFADCANLLASAIIPTPALRDAVRQVCRVANEAIERVETLYPTDKFPASHAAIAAVREAFKENEDGG